MSEPGEREGRLRFTVEHWGSVVGSAASRAGRPGRHPRRRRIALVLDRVPGLRLDVAERAGNGEFLFIRWVARLAGAPCPFEFGGIDRIQLRDGLVCEIRSYYDPALLEALHDHGQRRGPRGPRRIQPREQEGKPR